MTTSITTEKILYFYTYESFKELTLSLAERGRSTGDSSEEHIAATKINAQRIKRIDKQCIINPKLSEVVKQLRLKCTWIVLAESWCGDGAQIIPVIAKIAALNAHIELKIALRDDNQELMDAYLTNGSRAIPKLICIDKNSNQEIGTWGPRPAKIQQMVINYKMNNPGISHDEFVKNLHLWYAKDSTNAIQEDFINLFNEWNGYHIKAPFII